MRIDGRWLVGFSLLAMAGCMWFLAMRLGQMATLGEQVAAINAQLSRLRGEMHAVMTSGGKQNGPINATPDERPRSDAENIVLHQMSEAHAVINALDPQATAQTLAQTLADLDSWDMNPDEEKAFLDIKLALVTRLRLKVREEVLALQQAALTAPANAEGIAKHAQAGEVLAMYPMSQDKAVLDEARQLSAQQAELAVRLDGLRRQRYNLWAAQQIESAINDYNTNSSYWSAKKENKLLIDALVKNLGPVDPILLEPAVLELYNYIIPTTPLSLALCLSALTMREIRLVIAPLDPGHKGEALLHRIRMQG